MKIIPKIIGEVQTYYLKEVDKMKQMQLNIVNPKSDPANRSVEQQMDAASEIASKVNGSAGGEQMKVTVNTDPKDPKSVTNENFFVEYRNPNATRYNSWVDVFVKGAQDKEWQNSTYFQKDIFHLASNVPFTDEDLTTIEDVYADTDRINQQVIGGLGVILKNALARRSPLPEEMKVKLKAFDTMLAAAARNNGLNKKKSLERTMDVTLKAHYLKLQGRDSWAEARGNIMGLPENQNVIGSLLKKEINHILAGGSPDTHIKREILNLIIKQSDTRIKIKNRGEDSQPKDYIPVNLLLLYAVLIKDVALVRMAIEAEGQEIDPLEQSRVKGKFTPKLETILIGLVEHEEMSEIKNILINAHLIPRPKKIKPKLESKMKRKTIIISERQAKMLSMLDLDADTETVNESHEINDNEKILNNYLVKEGVEYYKITSKKDLLEQLTNRK